MSGFLFVSDAARELTQTLGVEITPRMLSNLFYGRVFPDELFPVVGGRRLIPKQYLGKVEKVVRNRLGLTPA